VHYVPFKWQLPSPAPTSDLRLAVPGKAKKEVVALSIEILSCVADKTDFGLDDWIYWHLIHSTRSYRQYSAIAILHLSSSPLHTHWGSQSSLVVSWQRIFQSHCHFKYHMSVLYTVWFISCHSRLSSSPLLPSSYPEGLASRNSNRLDYCSLLGRVFWMRSFITPRHGSHRKHSLYCWGVFTAPLPSNRRPIVARVGSCGNVLTESWPSNGYTRHIALNSLHAYHHFFFSEAWACNICDRSHLPSCGSGFRCVHYPTAPAATRSAWFPDKVTVRPCFFIRFFKRWGQNYL
jgi:hypothetical protein